MAEIIIKTESSDDIITELDDKFGRTIYEVKYLIAQMLQYNRDRAHNDRLNFKIKIDRECIICINNYIQGIRKNSPAEELEGDNNDTFYNNSIAVYSAANSKYAQALLDPELLDATIFVTKAELTKKTLTLTGATITKRDVENMYVYFIGDSIQKDCQKIEFNFSHKDDEEEIERRLESDKIFKDAVSTWAEQNIGDRSAQEKYIDEFDKNRRRKLIETANLMDKFMDTLKPEIRERILKGEGLFDVAAELGEKNDFVEMMKNAFPGSSKYPSVEGFRVEDGKFVIDITGQSTLPRRDDQGKSIIETSEGG